MQKLVKHLRAGQVYRRKQLEPYSTSIDRDLKTLVNQGLLRKASEGLYYKPKQSQFGELPPDNHRLIRAFLETEDFLSFSPNLLNSLDLGSTQLLNVTRVYNKKRHGRFILANKVFDFRRRPDYPTKLSLEFLFVEFLNEYQKMAEEVELSTDKIQSLSKRLNKKRFKSLMKCFGKKSAVRIYDEFKQILT